MSGKRDFLLYTVKPLSCFVYAVTVAYLVNYIFSLEKKMKLKEVKRTSTADEKVEFF